MNLCFQFWEMVEKVKRDVNRLLLAWKMKKCSILVKCIEKLFFTIKTKFYLF